MSEVVEKESKSGGGYVGRRLSRKEVKFMLMNATSPEARKAILELMPKPQKRYG